MGKCQQKHFNFIFYTASSRGFIEPGANIPGMLSAPRMFATRASARVSQQNPWVRGCSEMQMEMKSNVQGCIPTL